LPGIPDCDYKEAKLEWDDNREELPGDYSVGRKPGESTKIDWDKELGVERGEDESGKACPAGKGAGKQSSPGAKVKARYIEYCMKDFFESCVDKYKELGGPRASKLKKVSTPFIDEAKPFEDEEDIDIKGNPLGPVGLQSLQPIAAKILMKVLYGARMCRYDLLRPVCALAARVTKWDVDCDRKLHRLMCYIQSSLDVKMIGKVGDSMEDLVLGLYADADFAGCPITLRSTSGVFLRVEGSNTSFPLAGMSKKQTCVSHSTPESEIVAADLAARSQGLPALCLWEVILERYVGLNFYEDNQACIQIVGTGKNPTLRHMGRTHRVDVKWLHETFADAGFRMGYINSEDQAADIFTKAFTSKDKWSVVTWLIGHMTKADLVKPRPPVPERTKQKYDKLGNVIPGTVSRITKPLFVNPDLMSAVVPAGALRMMRMCRGG
jgi:hypothetical protein